MAIKYELLVKLDSFSELKKAILEPLNLGNYEPV